MQIYLKEKIGPKELFTGRKRELTKYLNWIDGVKSEISNSMAILSRRKTGKTALLQRLYNLTFHKNDGVIPFYYELSWGRQWAGAFCLDFFLSFIYQYFAFKTRKIKYLRFSKNPDLDAAIKVAREENLDYLIEVIEDVKYSAQHKHVDNLWTSVREAPFTVANLRDEFIVQFIDEFQLLNSEICGDKMAANPIEDFAAGYQGAAEYKKSPLLVSGSQVGRLMNILTTMLPGKFIVDELENVPEDEAIEMVFNYSRIMGVPVTEETAYMISGISEGNPFYISALFRSQAPDKDLATKEGLLRTLEYETLYKLGSIKGTWMEYVYFAFNPGNMWNEKRIVLHLCKNRHREVTREELLKILELDMTDSELERKMNTLVKCDVINQGRTNFSYQGIQDNIFDKVFRGFYQSDIEAYDEMEITNEYQELLNKAQKKYSKRPGEN